MEAMGKVMVIFLLSFLYQIYILIFCLIIIYVFLNILGEHGGEVDGSSGKGNGYIFFIIFILDFNSQILSYKGTKSSPYKLGKKTFIFF